MYEQEAGAQVYARDRLLLDEYGPGYIDRMCSYAEQMRTAGRVAETDEALRQCERMLTILMSDSELLAAYQSITRSDNGPARRIIEAEVRRRDLELEYPSQIVGRP